MLSKSKGDLPLDLQVMDLIIKLFLSITLFSHMAHFYVCKVFPFTLPDSSFSSIVFLHIHNRQEDNAIL